MPFLSNWPLLKRLALAPFRRSLTCFSHRAFIDSSRSAILSAARWMIALSFSFRSWLRHSMKVSVTSSVLSASSSWGILHSLTSMPSRIVVQSFLSSSCSNFLSKALFVPMMYRRFSCLRNSRLSSEVIPRSITQMRFDFPYRYSIISTMHLTVVTSTVFPAKTS